MYSLCDALCIYKIKRDINSALTMSFFDECLYRNPMFFPKSLGFFFMCKLIYGRIRKHSVDQEGRYKGKG